MSKLDYVTIGIVGICVAAIIFLVIKTTKLVNPKQPGIDRQRIENTLADQQGWEEDNYDTLNERSFIGDDIDDPDDDEVQYLDPIGEGQYRDPAPSRETATPAPSRPRETASTSSSAAAAGEYSVIAGTFRMKQNAESMVSKLRKLGYSSAEVSFTNRGAYAVAVVDRFDDPQAAKRLVEELKSKHKIDAIAKKRE
jgi:hypothetical protein